MKYRFLVVILGCLLAIALCLALFWGSLHFLRPLLPELPHAATTTTGPQYPAGDSIPSSSQTADPSLPINPAMSTGATRLSNGTAVFLATAEDMIAGYNRHWGSDYLRPLDTWRNFSDATSPCTGTKSVRRSFLLDESVLYWPAIDVFFAQNDTHILEVSLSLSEHDWNQEIDDVFVAQSRCMLSIFYPGLTEEQITELFGNLRKDAGENAYTSHSDVPKPLRVYVLDGTGCWGYTYSGMICINIIPMDDAFRADLSAKSIQIIDITR